MYLKQINCGNRTRFQIVFGSFKKFLKHRYQVSNNQETISLIFFGDKARYPHPKLCQSNIEQKSHEWAQQLDTYNSNELTDYDVAIREISKDVEQAKQKKGKKSVIIFFTDGKPTKFDISNVIDLCFSNLESIKYYATIMAGKQDPAAIGQIHEVLEKSGIKNHWT